MLIMFNDIFLLEFMLTFSIIITIFILSIEIINRKVQLRLIERVVSNSRVIEIFGSQVLDTDQLIIVKIFLNVPRMKKVYIKFVEELLSH